MLPRIRPPPQDWGTWMHGRSSFGWSVLSSEAFWALLASCVARTGAAQPHVSSRRNVSCPVSGGDRTRPFERTRDKSESEPHAIFVVDAAVLERHPGPLCKWGCCMRFVLAVLDRV